MIPMNIVVPEQMKKDLERIAKEQDRSVCSLVRVVIKDYLEKSSYSNSGCS